MPSHREATAVSTPSGAGAHRSLVSAPCYGSLEASVTRQPALVPGAPPRVSRRPRSEGRLSPVRHDDEDVDGCETTEEALRLATTLSGLRLTSAPGNGCSPATRRPAKFARLELPAWKFDGDGTAFLATPPKAAMSVPLAVAVASTMEDSAVARGSAASSTGAGLAAGSGSDMQAKPQAGGEDALAASAPKTPIRQRSSLRTRLFGDSPPTSGAPSPRAATSLPRYRAPRSPSPVVRSPLGSGMAIGGGIGPPSSAASARLSSPGSPPGFSYRSIVMRSSQGDCAFRQGLGSPPSRERLGVCGFGGSPSRSFSSSGPNREGLPFGSGGFDNLQGVFGKSGGFVIFED